MNHLSSVFSPVVKLGCVGMICVCVVVLVYVCASLVGIGSNHLFDVEGHQLDVRQCLPIHSPSRSLCVSLTTCTPLWKTCTRIHV